ncbi:hypothetical protein DSO57_1024627 [Entomophthora muscae]|uniref:Uncharacterized protein n=1 Tax=Entomophthora muscae TaxID=34485 RepID=A0ACC2U126_9FUNG|nr:hypothetical protein DSO57_1024627 [Entomophthora muscae]
MFHLPDFIIEEILSYLPRELRLVNKDWNLKMLPSVFFHMRRQLHVDNDSPYYNYGFTYYDSLIKNYGKFVKSFKLEFTKYSVYHLHGGPESIDKSVILCPYLKKWAGMLKNIKFLFLKSATVPQFMLFQDIISRATCLEVKTTKYSESSPLFELLGLKENQLYTLLEKNNFEYFLNGFAGLKKLKYKSKTDKNFFTLSLDLETQRVQEVFFGLRKTYSYHFTFDKESYMVLSSNSARCKKIRELKGVIGLHHQIDHLRFKSTQTRRGVPNPAARI